MAFRDFLPTLIGLASAFAFGPGAFNATAFAIGSMIGGILFAPKGPALDGAKVQKSAYGQFIPIVYGVFPGLAGNVIDCPEDGAIDELMTNKGVVRNFTGAILFCLGEAGDGLGQRRIDKLWGNDIVIFDRNGASEEEKNYFHHDGVSIGYDAATGMEHYAGYFNTRGLDKIKNQFWLYRGTRTQQPCPALADLHNGKVPAYRDCVYFACKDLMLQPWDESIPTFKAEIYNATTGVSSIITAHLVRGGCDADRLNLSAITGTVAGCIQAQKEAPQNLADTLASWRFCDLVEADAAIKAADRTSPTIITLSHDELGAHDAGEGGGDGEIPPALKLTVGAASQVPTILRARFYDTGLNGQINEVTAHRQVSDEPYEETLDLPIVSDVATMQAWAQTALDEAWMGRTPVEVSLPPSRLKCAPGDVLRIPNESGVLADYRIVEQTLATPGVIACSCASYNGEPYSQLHAPGGVDAPPAVIVPVVAPAYVLLDTVSLDAQSAASALPVLIFAASAPASADFAPPTIRTSDKRELVSVNRRATLGISSAALIAPVDISLFDDSQTTRVTLTDTRQTLATVTREQARQGANLAAIGRHILRFTTATYVSPGVYDISGFLFGIRGSEWAAMPAGAKFLLLYDATGARMSTWEAAPLSGNGSGLTLHYSRADRSAPAAFALEKNSLKALAPAMIRNSSDGAGGTILKFAARIRGDAGEVAGQSGATPDLTDALSFDVVLMNGATVLSTRRVTATSLVSGTTGQMATIYTAGQLSEIYGAPPATITGKIYALNGQGRGFNRAFALSV